MRLQELFETSEDDRALILLSSAIYKKIQPYFDIDDDRITHIGKIGDIVNTSVPELNSVNIAIEGGQDFVEHSRDVDDPEEYNGKTVYAFWDEDTHTIVLNKDLLETHRMKTTITHELRHALDQVRSHSYPYGAARYFTPKKKEHRINDPYSTVQYRAQPAEINARFVEVLDILSKRIPKWYAKLESSAIKQQLSTDFKHLLVKYEIADLFPEKTQSSDYRRLVRRAYDFMQKEIYHVEAELSKDGVQKHATGSW